MRALVLIALAGCDAASSSPGLFDMLQIEGAQYRPGPFPADHGGPAAVQLTTTHEMIAIDQTDEKITALLDPGARSAIFGLQGVDGAWILPAGPPGADALGRPTTTATMAFTQATSAGPLTLQVTAGDADGTTGAAAVEDVIAVVAPPPAGQLVISLEWDGVADLDLHVIDPLGGEAWSDKPSTRPVPPPGMVVSPTDFLLGGVLDHDGNADCRRDGEPSEHVIWHVTDALLPGQVGNPLPPPPSGDYIVRVDARSMCGDPDAPWYVFASLADGTVLGEARGIAVPDDVTYEPHSFGAGVTALRFTLP